MKRMVKNGDLIDVEPDGSGVTFGGNLKVGGTIIANGEIRGGDVSASKFYLGTEEMPLVKANPAGDATGTLEKIKIGNVAYKVGGGGSSDREITLTMPYPSDDKSSNKKVYIDDELYNKISQFYYNTIKLFFNDGNPIGVFNVFNLIDYDVPFGSDTKGYACLAIEWPTSSSSAWYGAFKDYGIVAYIVLSSDSTGKFLKINARSKQRIPDLQQSKFDALYKLADKPTQDGTYVLKATVSGGAVTYAWVAQ